MSRRPNVQVLTQETKRVRSDEIIPNQFGIIKEVGFERIYDYLMSFDNNVIAGGYPGAMFYRAELFENSDVDVFCMDLNVETFVISMKILFPLEYQVIHERLVDVIFVGFHRKVSFISITSKPGESNPVKQILEDFDSSYCKAAIHRGIPYIAKEILVARDTHQVFFHIYPRKKRVEKMLEKGFTFAGYTYKEIYDEFRLDETTPNFLLINHINTMAATDFTLAKFEDPNEVKNLFVYDNSKKCDNGGYWNDRKPNYFVSDGIPFYSVNYDGAQPLKYTEQRNGIICPYYELDTYYGDMRNRVYVSFVLELQGTYDWNGFMILDSESNQKHENYIKHILKQLDLNQNRSINKIEYGFDGENMLLLVGDDNLPRFNKADIFLNKEVTFTIQFFILKSESWPFTRVVNKIICMSTN